MGIIESLLGGGSEPATPMTIPDRPAAPGQADQSSQAALFRALMRQRQGRDSLIIPPSPQAPRDGATPTAISAPGLVMPPTIR